MGEPLRRSLNARFGNIITGIGSMGKTTTANSGIALVSFDKNVVCTDTDIGLRNLDGVMGLEHRFVVNLVDVIEDRCRLTQAIQQTLIANNPLRSQRLRHR